MMPDSPYATKAPPRPPAWRRLLDRVWAIRKPGGAAAFRQWSKVFLRQEIDRRRAAWWQFLAETRSRRLRAKTPRTTVIHEKSVPAFDLRAYNPIGLRSVPTDDAATLGPTEWLPPGVEARRVVHRRNLRRLRKIHHLEDVSAYHPDAVTRAGELARLAAAGVVTHLADHDKHLRPLLGDDLYRMMTADISGMDTSRRKLLSVRMRRAALRDHSSWARARRRGQGELPTVSVLLATRRPGFLPYALDSVARQTYPNLELVLALHGEDFRNSEPQVAEFPHPVKILRIPASEPLGCALRAATEASGGALLSKMDDDDVYGADHLWDLVLAREYSEAQLVGKSHEFVYLAGSDQTVNARGESIERYRMSNLDGGALLISRQDLAHAGGWRPEPRHVDFALWKDVAKAGGRLYSAHGAGFMLVRHGYRHTWHMSDDYFLARADKITPGWNPALAGIDDLNLPHPALDRE